MRHFDITRLAKRVVAGVPSGIDRVDLAYLQWLRGQGPVRYLVHGLAGFSPVNGRLGDALADDLAAAWVGRGPGLDPARLKPFRDPSLRLRAAGKWRKRRSGLREIQRIPTMEELCGPGWRENLDLLDASAGLGTYRVHPSWRVDSKRGCYFGISHSMLGRTAFLAALSRQSRLGRVLFIHDTIPCDFPEYSRALEGPKHLLRVRNAFRYATHLVVNSRYTAERLEHWRQVLDAPERPVAVLPIGVEDGLLEHSRAAPPPPAGRPYFVILGTIEPRKNHLLLLQMWRRFAETMPQAEIPKLWVIGRRGWENEAVFRMLDRCDALKPHVEEMNSLADDRLWPLLRGARAMLFPSFVEGWGMPMVEALALGVPVIASDIAAFREAGAGFPDLLPAIDGDAWSRAVLDYAQPGCAARGRQLERLPGYRPPTWRGHFETLADWLGPDLVGIDPSDHERH